MEPGKVQGDGKAEQRPSDGAKNDTDIPGWMREIIQRLNSSHPGAVQNTRDLHNVLTFDIQARTLHDILNELKMKWHFDHLSDVTCADFMDENAFELIYHIWSHTQKSRCNIHVRIKRDSPEVRTVYDIWPSAQMHERENHEMFGVRFEGNPDLSPLFLEDWKEIPPFRKDFNSREYVKKELEDD